MDLSIILKDWPFDENDNCNNVRKIVGADGRRKLQLRLRNGLIQWEVEGRPDGIRPHGFPSVLDYCRALIKGQDPLAATAGGGTVVISSSLLHDLRDEMHCFLKRGRALLRAGDYAGAAGDAQHGLEILAFLQRFGGGTIRARVCERFRPRLVLERARAEALLQLQQLQPQQAIQTLTEGIIAIEDDYRRQGMEEKMRSGRQRKMLIDFRRSLRERYRIPLTDVELLQTLLREQEVAIEEENYEMAAHLRDKIALLKARLRDES